MLPKRFYSNITFQAGIKILYRLSLTSTDWLTSQRIICPRTQSVFVGKGFALPATWHISRVFGTVERNVSTCFFIPLAGVYANFVDHCKTELGDSQLPDLVDYDEYDASVFRNPITHSALKGFLPRELGFRRIRSALEVQRMAKSASRDELVFHRVSSPPRGVSSFEDLEISSSSSSFMVSYRKFCKTLRCHCDSASRQGNAKDITMHVTVLTEHKGRTRRMSGRVRGVYGKDQGPICSQYGPEHSWWMAENTFIEISGKRKG